MRNFPKGFLWGSATSSYQVEGGIDRCDWALAAEEGKVPACGKAADHYHLYSGDFDIAKSLGQNAHRFSVEWARIEPIEGQFNQVEIDHYRKVLQDLKNKGFYVSLTMWHFTLPDWFSEKGGFEHYRSPETFARYTKKIVEAFNDLVDDFCTINEPMVYVSNGYIRGNWPPFKKTFWQHCSVHKRIAKAHILSYKNIKKDFPGVTLGIVKDNIFFEGKNIFTKFAARYVIWFWNHRFLNKIKDHVDYIGLNYYFHTVLGEKPKGPFTDFGWSIYPRGISEMLKDLTRYNVPLYITENGLADEDDAMRADFIKDHLVEVHKAIQDGVDVRGYYHWSLLDNFEWAAGFGKRFGLVEIDYDTMERNIRNSAYVYKSICENNGF
jgi:beta-glucosidase